QEIIDKAVAGRNPHDRSTRVTVCIRPGRYELERPLVLEHQHGHLHLEGCGEGVELAVAPGLETGFKQGMIVMAHADDVRISGIEFHLPQVPAATASIRPQEKELKSFQQPVADVYAGLFVSIGIRPVHCAMLEIDHCLFHFTLGPASTGRAAEPTQLAAGAEAGATNIKVLSVAGMSVGERICIDTGANLEAVTINAIGTAGTQGGGVTLAEPLEMAHQRGTPVGDCSALQETPRNVFGAAIFAGSECWGMRLERNRFLHDEPRQPSRAQARVEHVLVGLLLSPSLVYRSTEAGLASRLPSGTLVRTLLVGGRIRDNEFQGLTLGVLAMAEIGDVRFEDNIARDCFGGIWLYSQRALAYADLAGKYTVAGNLEQATLQGLRAVLVDAAANPTLVQISVIARTYPLPDQFLATAEDRLVAKLTQIRKKKAEAAAWTQQFVDKATAVFQQVAEPTEAGATPKPVALSLAAPAPKNQTEVTAAQLHAVLSDFELAVALAPAEHGFDVRVTDNDLDCAVGETGTTGAALLVWNTDEEAASTALVSDNRMSGLTQAPVASLQGIGQAIANGNLVTNREREGLSLSIAAPDDAAVTGNILHGTPLLPARPLPAPFNDWLSLNTVR
ncbi:MAG TPA: hypothetical protein VGP56_00195, partial [Gaiellaceae bacterium]|nr:hypothetical protein [Gaiellaceae bacterium]